MPAKTKDPGPMEITPITIGQMVFDVIGVSPLIYNSMSVKVRRDLLLPARRTKVEQRQTLKHDPLSEYRASTYRTSKGPTALVVPAPMFKRAISNAAVDVGGATKAELGRLLWVSGYSIEMFGVPQMMMSVMRDAGLSKAPRIRTRAILPAWTCSFLIEFVKPNLTETAVATILSAAGLICGIGDSRPQRGHGAFGQFRLATQEDAALVGAIRESGARAQQEAALREPQFFDDESEELFTWFNEEVARRGQSDMLGGDEEEHEEFGEEMAEAAQ
jgi:hypothetical protein